MTAPLVESATGLTLLGGGELGTDDLSDALSLAPDLVAADYGATHALAAGHLPLAVFGDMDSVPPEVRARLPADRFHLISDQDSTDFDKVLANVRGPFAIGVGFLGRRIDHELANLNALVRLRHVPCLLIGARDVVFAAPPHLAMPLAPGTRVSLFPLAPVAGTSDGLHWPIDGLAMRPDGLHGTSNRMASSAAGLELSFEAPGMVIILPRRVLRDALTALRQAPRWRPHSPAI
ncbi:MAG: thiamine diphosphokinase [Pseudomonadota bacterium]